jgi:RHS repeat-associated protein
VDDVCESHELAEGKLMKLRALALICIALLPVALFGAKPPKVPPGQGKYVMVLWDAGTPVPGSTGGEKIKKVPEPDLGKFGGTLLHKQDNRRVVLLPLGVAKQLRKHEAVVYLQRLWEGESLQDWDETAPSSGLNVRTDADVDLTWGPKAYTYDGEGNVTAFGSDSFVYDAVGRLRQATVNGKTETYTYDAFGNLVQKGIPAGATIDYPVDGTSNRSAGSGYDAAGNLLTRAGRTEYTYDAMNMMIKSRNGRRMIYDANDERIGTIMDSSLSRWTMRGFDGQILREFKADSLGTDMIWYWHLDHFRGEGVLLAGDSQQWGYFGDTWGGKRHYHLDHLGSVRVVTDSQGRSLSEHDFYPFGVSQTKTYQEQIDWGDPHIDAMRFAGHWRDFLGWLDVENSDYLDYMHARYYDPNSGRFLSVDPIFQGAAMQSPQLWNRYTYTANNPVSRVDPDGRNWFRIQNTWEWHEGSVYKDANGKTHKSDYEYLIVVEKTGKDKKGASTYKVTLYHQNVQVMTGTAFSGGADGAAPINPGSYRILTSEKDPVGPTQLSTSTLAPPAHFGIQQLTQARLQYPGADLWVENVNLSWGMMRARLNPWSKSSTDRGLYYHGQLPGAPNEGQTHGCLSYGGDPAIIHYLWNLSTTVPVTVDETVTP